MSDFKYYPFLTKCVLLDHNYYIVEREGKPDLRVCETCETIAKLEQQAPVKLQLEIQKADGMEGFAAYQVSPATAKKKVILLNVYATFYAVAETKGDINAKELIIENLMHEFGHILQQYFDIEMTEKMVEKFIASYAKKYHKDGYTQIHGDQTLQKKKKKK